MVVSKGNGLSTRVFDNIEVSETFKSSKEDYSPILEPSSEIDRCLEILQTLDQDTKRTEYEH